VSRWQPVASPGHLRQRAKVMRTIRHFFDRRDVTEVTTPVITPFGITDPNIDSLEMTGNEGFLRTSPEYQHKRLLAAGFGDLYEIGPVFRAGEHGRLHRTEFTLLEWYRVGWTWQEMAEEAITLVMACLAERPEWNQPPAFRSWQQCFEQVVGLDPLSAEQDQLVDLTGDLPTDCDRDMRLDYLFATRIQPSLGQHHITVVHGYPASQAALARLDPDNPLLAERFEVFLGAVELANGYRELTSASEQAERFEQDNRRRLSLGHRTMPVDHKLLAALEHGLPECSGVALGIDRLVMAVLDSTDIADTQSF
jgi:elongation factor P--(R)-beta-lysine ligase